MCGICGKLYYNKERLIEESEIKRMMSSIRHRGPDDEGCYISNNVGLGFRRLSIIDIQTGHQPISNEDGTIWIVFNGEIYNFLELRKTLLKSGHRFHSKTDTETIIHLYEEYGRDCLRHLRGMFSFAIWDTKDQKLFCARDRLGIKPFYYYCDNEKFVFGSEIKAILSSPDIRRDIDLHALDSYLTYGYSTDDRTIYNSVKKVKPAHFLEIQPRLTSDPIIQRYWDTRFEPDFTKTENEWCEEIRDALQESVSLHMISDVPLGAFLSGGIDSSSVVAMMSKTSSRQVKTFSIGFSEAKYDELDFAREVAKHYHTDHHEHIVAPESIELLPRLVHAYDEPFADSSAIPTYYVSKFAREHVTVALSGDGGDELFAGYPHYLKLIGLQKYNAIPAGVRKFLLQNISSIILGSRKMRNISYYLSKDVSNLGAHFALFNQPDRSKLYKRDIWKIISQDAAESYKERLIGRSPTEDFLSRYQQNDMQTYLVDDILTKVDIASMQNSLEVRVPLLDHVFVELACRIPSSLKIRNGVQKYIFKKAMTNNLSQVTLSHKKQGFEVPLNVWFKSDLYSYAEAKLGSPQSKCNDYFESGFVRSILKEHVSGRYDRSAQIWSLLFLDAWFDDIH